MIGMPITARTPFVIEILSRHPNGIYSTVDFVENITPEKTFYAVTVHPYHDSVTVEKFTLASIKEYEGEYADFIGKLQYSVKGSSYTMKFVDGIISGANGCFLHKEDADAYAKELREHISKVIIWVSPKSP